ncbi:GGDEF domain-containing protein [Carbonactinospora thermoautotrophica]|uniref:GGDEF domain-containing protein n=1 Tax=Carbonactinospora thermoautotrophica TaxID=1469144 RepID=UPI0008343927|nr:GGDEF domain-containing protein [Carbonactinospora thermoautotrophica]MCX9192992.1 GGDEF domain-containing protein [Carbonactinospora thermoautotrophica]
MPECIALLVTAMGGGLCLGLLGVHRALRRAGDAARRAELLAAQLSRIHQELADTLLAQRRLTDYLADLSLRDALTGLHNRRHFEGEHNRLFALALALGQPLCLAVADVDDFKSINDRFGHAVGDEVLRVIGQLFDTNSRERDVLARYGGEEFALLMPATTTRSAALACDRIRRKVENYPWDRLRAGLKVTVSVGVADNRNRAAPDEQFRAADDLLYLAKRLGKNQVRAADEPEATLLHRAGQAARSE